MKKDNSPPLISKNTLQSLKEAQESYQRFAENLANIVPKIPKFDLPKIPDLLQERETIELISPEVVREQSAWERHKEIIDIQNALLGVQSKLLNEQQANTKSTKIVIVLSVLAIVISIVTIFL